MILGFGLICVGIGGLGLAKEIETLKHSSQVLSLGTLQGDFDQYKKNNLKVWNAQYKFNNDVIAEFSKLHVLRSQNFTLESKDE